jgi:hypothetical protein
MLLSIGGVLAAGSAAALVNAKVLDERSSGAPPAATALSTTSIPAGVQLTAAPTVPPTSATPPSTTLPANTRAPIVVTAPPTTTTTVPVVTTAAGATQATYRLGDAGTALLDTAGGRLTVVRVVPNPGWSVDRAESDGPTSVEIRLESASGEVRFEASLVRGVVRVALDTDDDEGGSGSDSGHGGDDDNSGPGGGDDTSGRGSDD